MPVIGFTVAGGKIAEIDAIADLERVRRITASVGDGGLEGSARGSRG